MGKHRLGDVLAYELYFDRRNEGVIVWAVDYAVDVECLRRVQRGCGLSE